VTYNLKDFPAEVMAIHHIEAQHPDEFIMNQFELHELATLGAIKEMRASWKNPTRTGEEFWPFKILIPRGGLLIHALDHAPAFGLDVRLHLFDAALAALKPIQGMPAPAWPARWGLRTPRRATASRELSRRARWREQGKIIDRWTRSTQTLTPPFAR
jgi:hypothetical protein